MGEIKLISAYTKDFPNDKRGMYYLHFCEYIPSLNECKSHVSYEGDFTEKELFDLVRGKLKKGDKEVQ